jgi:hypothetical protein
MPPRKLIEHVLRFESLQEDFVALMLEYGLDHLTPLPRELVRKSLPKQLGMYNLTLSNLQLIERVYRQDFEEFGYDMKSSRIPKEILVRNQHLTRCKTKKTQIGYNK